MIDRIRARQHARPFVPYEIGLPGGRVFAVRNPDSVCFRDSGPGLVAIWDDDGHLHSVVAPQIVRVS
jgi:hypothetical protein